MFGSQIQDKYLLEKIVFKQKEILSTSNAYTSKLNRWIEAISKREEFDITQADPYGKYSIEDVYNYGILHLGKVSFAQMLTQCSYTK